MVQGALYWREGNKQTPSTVPPRCAWYMPLTRTRLLIYGVRRVDWDGEGVRVRLLFSGSDANQPPPLSTTFPVRYLHLPTFRYLSKITSKYIVYVYTYIYINREIGDAFWRYFWYMSKYLCRLAWGKNLPTPQMIQYYNINILLFNLYCTIN